MSSSDGKNYYEILEVSQDATVDDIRAAYRDKARKLHPDVNKAPDAAEQFAKVQEAHEILSDTEKRAAYDNYLRYGVRAGGPTGGPGGAGSPGGAGGQQWQAGSVSGFDPSDFASIFDQFMGGGQAGSSAGGVGYGPGSYAGRPAAPPRRGRDVRHDLSISFMKAARGDTEQIRLTVGETAQTIDVRIPAGIESGTKMRVRGKGYPSNSGGPAGDLILTITVGEHPYFRREGLDLLIDVPVSVSEACLGTTVTLPLLDGRIDLRIPAGTSSGRRLRVRGKGIAAADKTGDFFAVVQIHPPDPDSLTDEDREFFTEMGNRTKNPRATHPWSDME